MPGESYINPLWLPVIDWRRFCQLHSVAIMFSTGQRRSQGSENKAYLQLPVYAPAAQELAAASSRNSPATIAAAT